VNERSQEPTPTQLHDDLGMDGTFDSEEIDARPIHTSDAPRQELLGIRSHPCRTNHFANLAKHVVLGRTAESSVVDEPIRHLARSGPSTGGLRRVPMRHVAMKVLVANDLEKHDLAVVRSVPIGLEAANGPFQVLNVRRPRITEKSVS
jgi:hypothetical protein